MLPMHAIAELMAERLTFDCEQIVAIASGNTSKATMLDMRRQAIQELLDRAGVIHPCDMLCERYRLRGAEAMLLTLSLMPHHAPEALERLAEVLDDDEPTTHPRLWYVLALLEVPPDQAQEVVQSLLASTLFSERLVRTRPATPETLDATIHPSLSVLELVGLTESDG